jgi:hypothetical protein
MLPYDASGINTTNKVENEVHQIINSPAIFPINGAFYLNSLVIRATIKGTNTVKELSIVSDYGLGPLYASRAYNAGKHAYTYLVLYRIAEYESIELDYQAVGGMPDSVLLTEIANSTATDIDKQQPAFWLSLDGENCIRRTVDIDPDFKDMDILQLLYNSLKRIEDQLHSPTILVSEVSQQYGILVEQLTQDRDRFENLLAGMKFAIDNGQITINTIVGITKQKREILEVINGAITLSIEPINGIDGICNFGYIANLNLDGSTSYATVGAVLGDSMKFTVETNNEENWDGKMITIQYLYLQK